MGGEGKLCLHLLPDEAKGKDGHNGNTCDFQEFGEAIFTAVGHELLGIVPALPAVEDNLGEKGSDAEDERDSVTGGAMCCHSCDNGSAYAARCQLG